MAFEKFKQDILGYLDKAGISKVVTFEHDMEKGLFSAWIPGEEILITRNETGLGMSVRFRSHLYQVRA